jgi:hypothetical protein
MIQVFSQLIARLGFFLTWIYFYVFSWKEGLSIFIKL